MREFFTEISSRISLSESCCIDSLNLAMTWIMVGLRKGFSSRHSNAILRRCAKVSFLRGFSNVATLMLRGSGTLESFQLLLPDVGRLSMYLSLCSSLSWPFFALKRATRSAHKLRNETGVKGTPQRPGLFSYREAGNVVSCPTDGISPERLLFETSRSLRNVSPPRDPGIEP
nr:hypothetical protein Iba_chr01aCG10520 [Ipomoea batatas]